MRMFSRSSYRPSIPPLITDLAAQCPITSREVAWVAGVTVPIEWVIGVTAPGWLVPYGLTATGVYGATALAATFGPALWDRTRPAWLAIRTAIARSPRPAESSDGPAPVCRHCPNPATRRFIRADESDLMWVCDVHTPGPDGPAEPVQTTPAPAASTASTPAGGTR